MKIIVRILPPVINDQNEFVVELAEGSSVSDLIDKTTQLLGDKKNVLVNEEKKLMPAWRVFLNDRLLDSSNYFKTSLVQGDTVVFLLALAGG
ncbi:MAG: MoaD/ThiS family protein [Tepidanaerobacteraceae bacterium]|nr:MoaD/ThiS family protein [Tepidanaerobacteraceae bacterium]